MRDRPSIPARHALHPRRPPLALPHRRPAVPLPGLRRNAVAARRQIHRHRSGHRVGGTRGLRGSWRRMRARSGGVAARHRDARKRMVAGRRVACRLLPRARREWPEVRRRPGHRLLADAGQRRGACLVDERPRAGGEGGDPSGVAVVERLPEARASAPLVRVRGRRMRRSGGPQEVARVGGAHPPRRVAHAARYPVTIRSAPIVHWTGTVLPAHT